MVGQYLPQTNETCYSVLQCVMWLFAPFFTPSKHSHCFFTADYKLSIFEVKVIELALLLFDNLVFFYELYCLSSAFLYPLLALMQNRRCSWLARAWLLHHPSFKHAAQGGSGVRWPGTMKHRLFSKPRRQQEKKIEGDSQCQDCK